MMCYFQNFYRVHGSFSIFRNDRSTHVQIFQASQAPCYAPRCHMGLPRAHSAPNSHVFSSFESKQDHRHRFLMWLPWTASLAHHPTQMSQFCSQASRPWRHRQTTPPRPGFDPCGFCTVTGLTVSAQHNMRQVCTAGPWDTLMGGMVESPVLGTGDLHWRRLTCTGQASQLPDPECLHRDPLCTTMPPFAVYAVLDGQPSSFGHATIRGWQLSRFGILGHCYVILSFKHSNTFEER